MLAAIAVAPAHLAWSQPLNQRVMVVYNANSPDSLDVANYYTNRRGIPAANKCAIGPPAWDMLNRSDFDTYIRTPIKNCLNTLGPANILYIVFAYQTPWFILPPSNGLYGYANRQRRGGGNLRC